MQNAIEEIFHRAWEDEAVQRQTADYNARHGINSAAILTVMDDERGDLTADYLAERITGKTVIEIGGGIGLLALHMSQHAKQVICIEANPLWTSVWVAHLHRHKPKNVTFIFGAADEVAGMIRGDVALFCTHSDHNGMARTAALFAPEVIDVYREIQGGKTSMQLMVEKFNKMEVEFGG